MEKENIALNLANFNLKVNKKNRYIGYTLLNHRASLNDSFKQIFKRKNYIHLYIIYLFVKCVVWFANKEVIHAADFIYIFAPDTHY